MDYNCQKPVEYYYERVEPYRDQFGLMAQAPPQRDGGDSAHRIGLFYYGLYLLYKDNKVIVTKINQDFKTDLKKITVETGKFVRNPDPNMWYSNPNNFTRDQTMPLIIAMGSLGDEYKDHLDKNLKAIAHNNGFFPNRLKNYTNEEKHLPFDYMDPVGPPDYGAYVRSLRKHEYKWFLYISDSFLVISSALRIGYSVFDKVDTSNDLNFTLKLLQAKEIYPTFIADFAIYLYKFRRRAPPTSVDGVGENGIESAWNYYFRPEGNDPPINAVYKCVIRKYFYDQK